MPKKLQKIRELVKKECEEKDWRYHILPVVKYAKKLAKDYKVNIETVELAALLHDIGRIRLKDDENHHISGVPEAEKILKKYNYSKEIIEEVKHCVESHRGSKSIKPRTIIAKIITNADAMAHFDILPIFFYWNHEKSFEGIVIWLKEKLKRDINKKITFPKARKMIEKKHKAINLILNSLKEYIKK